VSATGSITSPGISSIYQAADAAAVGSDTSLTTSAVTPF
jgi:hypothetical protein